MQAAGSRQLGAWSWELGGPSLEPPSGGLRKRGPGDTLILVPDLQIPIVTAPSTRAARERMRPSWGSPGLWSTEHQHPVASAERQHGLGVAHNVPVHQLKGVNEQLHPVLPLASRGELGPLGGVDQHGHQPGVGGRVLRELRGV